MISEKQIEILKNIIKIQGRCSSYSPNARLHCSQCYLNGKIECFHVDILRESKRIINEYDNLNWVLNDGK